MLIELDVFSGRPNPRWTLDEASARELRQLMSGLAVTSDAPPDPPGLGYRGFVLTDVDGGARAYKGYVTTSGAAHADPAASVEHFLLEKLPAEFQELRRRVAL